MIFERYEKISLTYGRGLHDIYKPRKSQDLIVLEGLFPSSISKTLQQRKYDLQDTFTKLKND